MTHHYASPPRPDRRRRRGAAAVGLTTAALTSAALTAGALVASGAAAVPAAAVPAAAVPAAAVAPGKALSTGWTAEQGGRSIVLDLEGQGVRDLVTVRWRNTAAASVRGTCTLVVAAPAGGGWTNLAEVPLAVGESGTRDVAFPPTDAERLRVTLAKCRNGRLTALADRITVRTASLSRTPVRASFDDQPVGVGPYLWDYDGQVSVEVPPGDAAASRALVVRERAGARSSSWAWFPRAEVVRASYRMRVDDPAAPSSVGLRDRPDVPESAVQPIAVVGFENGTIYASGRDARTPLGTYRPGEFRAVTITLRPAAGTFDVDLDGTRVATDLPVRPSSATTVNSLIVAGEAGADATWLDDVAITTTTTTATTREFRGPFDTAPVRRMGTLASPPARTGAGFAGTTFSVGAETLDRGYADISAYVGQVCRLGIGNARLQAGWNRIERTVGTYDFSRLDAEVDALSRCGIRPWIELSYGNFQVPGGGGTNLGGLLPTNLQKWQEFVTATVRRYGDRVSTWSVWNEPSNNPANSGTAYGRFAAVTATTVAAEQPQAEIIAGNTASVPETEFVREALTEVRTAGALDLIDLWGFHGYPDNPDSTYGDLGATPSGGVAALRAVVDEFAPRIVLMQTENGAPSVYSGTFALKDRPWTETTQAKWDTRRMLGDNARGLRTNVFTSADLRYAFTPTTVTWNPKGLVQVDGNKQVVRRKAAFRAVQAAATLFNDTALVRRPDALVRTASDQRLSAFGYRWAGSDAPAVAYWRNTDTPTNQRATSGFADLTVPARAGERFVLVDVLTGDVHAVPRSRVTGGADGTATVRVEVSDGPLVLTTARGVRPLLG